MSRNQALVEQARPYISASLARAFLANESVKGCQPDVAPFPVQLEPVYLDLATITDLTPRGPSYVRAELPAWRDILRYSVWLPPGFQCDFLRAERFLKQLQACSHPCSYEVAGNRDRIVLTFSCHRDDAGLLGAAFIGEFSDCRLTPQAKSPYDDIPLDWWDRIAFRDYYPAPSYYEIFTQPAELGVSPIKSLLNVMACLPGTALGVYQVVFAATRRSGWKRNVEVLSDLSYAQKTYEGMQPYHRQGQLPSSDLTGTSREIDTKAHNDRPLLFAQARTALFADASLDAEQALSSFSGFMGLILHGGMPLSFVDQAGFRKSHGTDAFRNMLGLNATYRPGFLANSRELCSFINLPPLPPGGRNRLPIELLDGFQPPVQDLSLGVLVGHRLDAGTLVPMHIPWDVCHGHILGVSDQGKSRLILNQCLQIITAGYGVAIIDPHGDLAQRLLGLIPESEIDRVVYFALDDPEWIPRWNLLRLHPGQNPSRVGDELVSAMARISEGWGDRVAYLLAQTFGGLLRLGDATFFDAMVLLSKDCPEKDRLRERILMATDNALQTKFFSTEYKGYGALERQSSHHKLAKLLGNDQIARMLAQNDNSFDFRHHIMDEGRIFIADLSTAGPEACDVLGTFFMSLIFLAALSRSDIPDESERKSFFVHVDEAQRFVSGAMTDVITQCRKFKTFACLAHQVLSQFKDADIDSLCSTGFTSVFKVLHKDATRLVGTIGGDIDPKVMSSLNRMEFLLRVGNDWVRIKSVLDERKPNRELARRIIDQCHEKYYAKLADLPHGKKTVTSLRARPAFESETSNETEDDYAFDRLQKKEDGGDDAEPRTGVVGPSPHTGRHRRAAGSRSRRIPTGGED